jgi:hypothetical protein
MPVPRLTLPRLFEPEFCRKLIALYDARRASRPVVFRDVNGQNVGLEDDHFKRAGQDYYLEDRATILETQMRLPAVSPRKSRALFLQGEPHGALHHRLLTQLKTAAISRRTVTTP